MLLLTLIFALLRLGLSVDPILQAKYESLSSEEFVKYFNEQGYSWTAAEHAHLEGIRFNCSLPENYDELYPTVVHEFIGDLPSNLDARQKWSNCPTIGEIYSQGNCGSCWAFGMGTTASDRICIKTGKTVRLSQQDLACCKNCAPDGVCNGGYPDRAFQFWIQTGIVSSECRPYNIPELMSGRGCQQQCSNRADYNGDKNYGAKAYAVGRDENTIKVELFTNGPIEASMIVYSDFLKYAGGIYDHLTGHQEGYHSVRVLGYGVENNIPFWLGANSWGPSWGERGFFRIKRFQSDNIFERYLFTGTPR